MDKNKIEQELLAAYREKRKWDGGEGRVWNASKHLDADDLIKKLEGELNNEKNQHHHRREVT